MQAPLHMLGAPLRSLILSPSLAASGFIRSPVTAEPWPGAPGTPEGFTPTLTSRLQISINEIKVVLSCAFIYRTRDFRQTERKVEAR